MKKFILMFMVALMACMTISAQEYAYSGNKVLDNTYVGISVGATTPLNQSYSLNSIFPINTNIGIKVGKNFDPVFGVNVEGIAWLGSMTKDGHWTVDEGNFIKTTTVGANGTINLSNLFFGYKGKPRFIEFSPETGLSWLHFYSASVNDSRNFIAAKTGLNIAFNICKTSQIVLEPAIFWNLNSTNVENIEFNSNHAQLGLSLGYIYKFKTSNGTHNIKKYNITELNNTINSLRSENDSLKNIKPTKIEVEKLSYVPGQVIVYFAQNSSELTEDAKASLKSVKGNVDILATASPEGTAEYNMKLSEQRASNVANFLKENNVNVNSYKGLGSTGNSSNRVAVITAIK